MQSDATVHEPAQPPTRRLRFSLRGFLVAVGVVCLVVSNTVALRELVQLRNENRQLRDELGHLTIGDPERFHVVSATQLEDLKWRWRIYVPNDRLLGFYVDWDDAERGRKSGKNFASVTLDPGEHSVELGVFRDGKGDWKVKLQAANRLEGSGQTSRGALSASITERLQSRTSHIDQMPYRGTVAFDGRPQTVLQEYFPDAVVFGGTDDSARSGLRASLEEVKIPTF